MLRDGDFVLWETIAILQYLAALDPDAQLLPREERMRADTARWMTWGLAHWNPALQPFIFERIFKPLKGIGEPDEKRLETLRPKLDSAATVLEGQLARTQSVCGSRTSIADIYLAAYPMYAAQAGINLDSYPRVRAWLHTMHELPHWRSAASG